VYHQKEERVTAHLFITLLAYHLVHTIRYQLKMKGIHLSWNSIRQQLSSQQRITVSMTSIDQKTIFIRTTSKAEAMQEKLFDAMEISTDPIGNVKTIIDKTKNL